MENSVEYFNHVNIVKDLNLYTTIRDHQRPIEKEYEEIYAKAKEADLKLGTAKEFLNSLTSYELSILRKFDSLADTIDVDVLSNEGAYNLIVHDWEEYDFNNDGLVQVGIADNLSNIPRHLDDEAKKVWVETLNSMDMEKDFMSIGVIVMSFHDDLLKRHIAEGLSRLSDAEIDKMQESASYDIRSFINETLSKPYNPETISVLDVLKTVNDIINQNGHKSSPEMIESTKHLKEALLNAIEKVKEEAKIEMLSTQKELEIKQELIDKANEEKEEPLAVAIAITSNEGLTTEEIIEKYRAMPGQGGVFDMDAYKEELAIKQASYEPYFKAEYEHYEKYKDVFTPMYSNYTTEKANNISRELNAAFPEFGAMREKAYMGGTQKDKEAFEDMFWDYQAYNKFLREKYDMDMSTGGFMAATKESSKAYNLAIYDSLESGMNIEEATAKAQSLLSTFGGREAMSFSLMFFSGLPEDIEAATEIPEEEIDYDKQVDLREYGFEHNFWTEAYLNNFEDDELGIKAIIMYDMKLYSFLLDNPEIVDNELENLKIRAYETKQGKEWYDLQNEDGKFNEVFKGSFQSKYDNALYAKEIYDKYSDKIFDNTILDTMGKT